MSKKIVLWLMVSVFALGSAGLVHAKPDMEKAKGGKHDVDSVIDDASEYRDDVSVEKEKIKHRKDKMKKEKARDDRSRDERSRDDQSRDEKSRDEDSESEEMDHDSDAKGLEKKRHKKAEQERRELDKGSEQGQAMREEHSRKWWKFWE